nr:MAG TPA: hypothetical protein [Caudoviricetes sp.]
MNIISCSHKKRGYIQKDIPSLHILNTIAFALRFQ